MFAVDNFPLIQEGDDLSELILAYGPLPGDVIAVAQKVISKAEGRQRSLSDVIPSEQAEQFSEVTDKDPRLLELILSESKRVVRAAPGIMIVEHRLGFVMANAGIDASNVGGSDKVLLLPENPDSTAQNLASSIRKRTGVNVGVVITDSWGRPWRLGTVGFALGVAGIPALIDMTGKEDLDGRVLQSTHIGIADELAAAASLLMGQAAEAQPVIIIRGLKIPPSSGEAKDLIRPLVDDHFRL
jgi:coenzyme F420-0:L-glutamate ligase/coenzyme F420-1:gamma-L-glutamate ligase